MTRTLVLTACVALATSGCGYNRIQTLDEQVNGYRSQIEVQLQRRADLVPNLVNTVKGFAEQELAIFEEVSNARARLSGAVEGGTLSSRTIPRFSRTRTSVHCRTSWRAPRTESPPPAWTTTMQCGSTTRTSGGSPRCSRRK